MLQVQLENRQVEEEAIILQSQKESKKQSLKSTSFEVLFKD